MYNEYRNKQVAQATVASDRYISVVDANGKYSYRNSDYSCHDDKKVMVSLPAANSVPSALASAQIDFRIEPGSIDVLDYPCLDMLFTNGTGSNATMNSLALSIQRLDVVSASGNVLHSILGQELHLSNQFLNKDTYDALCIDMGTTTAYAQAVTATADAATLNLVQPIFPFFKAAKLYIGGMKGAIILRFYFNASTYTVVTGAAMTLTSAALILVGKQLKESAKAAIRDVWLSPNIPLRLAHLTIDRITSTQTLTAGQIVNLPLNGLSGLCAFLIITVRIASTALTTAPIAYLPLGTIDVKANNGNSLCGSYARTARMRHIQSAILFANASNATGAEIIPFCADPVSAWSRGENSGYAVLTSNESLQFVCPAAITTVSHIITVMAYNYTDLVSFNGVLSDARN